MRERLMVRGWKQWRHTSSLQPLTSSIVSIPPASNELKSC